MAGRTKKIKEVYDVELEKVNKKEEETITPEKKAKQVKISQIKEKANQIKNQDFAEIKNSFDSFLSNFVAWQSTYAELEQALKIKREELSTFYDIEAHANSVFALIDSQEELKNQYTEEMKAIKDEWDLKIETLKKNFELSKQQLDEARKKDVAEYNYNWQWKSKKDENDFEEMKRQREKELQFLIDKEKESLMEYEKELNEREEDITAREEEIQNMENKIASFPENLEEAVQKAIEETEAKEEKAATYRINIMKSDHNGKISLLENKIETLEKNLDAANKTIETLNNKLELAYTSQKELASKTVESASSKNYASALEQFLKDSGKNIQNK